MTKASAWVACSCKVMQRHAKLCNVIQSHAKSCNVMQSCNLMQSHAISCKVMQCMQGKQAGWVTHLLSQFYSPVTTFRLYSGFFRYSCHSSHCKHGIPYSHALRICRICSRTQDYLQQVNEMMEGDEVQIQIDMATRIDRAALLWSRKVKAPLDQVLLTTTSLQLPGKARIQTKRHNRRVKLTEQVCESTSLLTLHTLHDFAWHCMTLHDFAWLCMTLHDFEWTYHSCTCFSCLHKNTWSCYKQTWTESDHVP